MRDRLVPAPRQPANFAEIDAEERHARRELDRTRYPIDGLAELARLVGDETEEMERFGLIGMCRKDLAAARLRLDQAPGGAMVLGDCERISRQGR
jgi:hypothetical protein